jgi:hypothetical protein
VIPEIGASNIFNGNLGKLVIEIKGSVNSELVSTAVRVDDGEDILHVIGAVLMLHFMDKNIKTVVIIKFFFIIEGERQQIEFLVCPFGCFLKKQGAIFRRKF